MVGWSPSTIGDTSTASVPSSSATITGQQRCWRARDVSASAQPGPSSSETNRVPARRHQQVGAHERVARGDVAGGPAGRVARRPRGAVVDPDAEHDQARVRAGSARQRDACRAAASGVRTSRPTSRPPSRSSSTSSPPGTSTSSVRPVVRSSSGHGQQRDLAGDRLVERDPPGAADEQLVDRLPPVVGAAAARPRGLHLQEAQVQVERSRPAAASTHAPRPTSRSPRRRRPRRRRPGRACRTASAPGSSATRRGRGRAGSPRRARRRRPGGRRSRRHGALTSSRQQRRRRVCSQRRQAAGRPVAGRARRWCRGPAGSSRCRGSRGPSARRQDATGSRHCASSDQDSCSTAKPVLAAGENGAAEQQHERHVAVRAARAGTSWPLTSKS